MPGFDDVEIELTLEKVHTRNPNDDSVEERWQVDAPGLDMPCGADTPERALEVLAESLRDDDDGIGPDDLSTHLDGRADVRTVAQCEMVHRRYLSRPRPLRRRDAEPDREADEETDEHTERGQTTQTRVEHLVVHLKADA